MVYSWRRWFSMDRLLRHDGIGAKVALHQPLAGDHLQLFQLGNLWKPLEVVLLSQIHNSEYGGYLTHSLILPWLLTPESSWAAHHEAPGKEVQDAPEHYSQVGQQRARETCGHCRGQSTCHGPLANSHEIHPYDYSRAETQQSKPLNGIMAYFLIISPIFERKNPFDLPISCLTMSLSYQERHRKAAEWENPWSPVQIFPDKAIHYVPL